jgi:hypothetical protein
MNGEVRQMPAAINKCRKPIVDNDLKQALQGANDLKNG